MQEGHGSTAGLRGERCWSPSSHVLTAKRLQCQNLKDAIIYETATTLQMCTWKMHGFDSRSGNQLY